MIKNEFIQQKKTKFFHTRMKGNLAKHQTEGNINSHNQSYKCPRCHVKYDSINKHQKRHVKISKLNQDINFCKQCSFSSCTMVELRWHEISKHENVKESQIFTSDLENIAIKQELDQSMDFQNLSKTPEISNENSLISIRNKPLPELESKSRGDLNRHTLSIHEKQKPFDKHGVQKKHLFPCKYCGAIKTSKQKLYIHHMGVHEGNN